MFITVFNFYGCISISTDVFIQSTDYNSIKILSNADNEEIGHSHGFLFHNEGIDPQLLSSLRRFTPCSLSTAGRGSAIPDLFRCRFTDAGTLWASAVRFPHRP